ncbi:hypothetical protein MPSEU_000671600 [Mayamaea pseudoterrestris]|nr:hypothetical protein MPSEU_000671600 [Mayamaea pseudoterrestris]
MQLANFAAALLRLGKQNGPLSTTLSRQQSTTSTQLVESIVGQFNKTWFNVSQVLYHPNPVFLYETTQLSDADFEPEFRHDLQAFLNLSSPILGPIPSYKPGMSWTNASIQAAKNALKINICRDEYLLVRAELMRLAKLTSEWIVSEFMHYPSVTVSGRARFEQIMNGWKRDPCLKA